MKEGSPLVFNVIGGRKVSGTVRDANATVGTVAVHAARHLNVAGVFEVIGPGGDVIKPDTPLSELPDDVDTYGLSPALTPAVR